MEYLVNMIVAPLVYCDDNDYCETFTGCTLNAIICTTNNDDCPSNTSSNCPEY